MTPAVRRNAGYAALSGVYWMLYCAALGFSSVFLLSRGFANTQIGLLIALGQVAGLILQPALAAIADRGKRAPVLTIGACGLAVALMAAALLLLPGGSSAAALFVIIVAVVMALQPLVNAFSFRLERLGTPIRFGACRAAGSLCYAALSAVLGAVTARSGAATVPIATAGAAALIALIIALLGREGVPPDEPRAREDGGRTDGFASLLLRRRAFLALLAATAFIFFAHATVTNFTLQIVTGVGGDSGDMGLIGAYVAVLELPVMLLFDRLRRRFSVAAMLRFSAVFFLVKTALVACAASMAGLYAGLFFQFLSFPMFTPASVRFAGEQMPASAQNKAQAAVTAMITVGNICASAVGGAIIDRSGVRACLVVASACAAVGAVIMIFGVRGRGAARMQNSHTEKEII